MVESYDFKITKNNSDAINTIARMFFKSEYEIGFALYGNVDTGKTYFSKIFCNIIKAANLGIGIYYMTANYLATCMLKVGVKNGEYWDDPFEIDVLWKWHRLLVDDIGTEPKVVKSFGTDIMPFAELVQQRYDANLPLYITSNLSEKAIGEVYGERISSRLKEMCYSVVFEGKDLWRGK
jgi:DNA replication protein DnaC